MRLLLGLSYACFLSFCMITIAFSQSARDNLRVMSYNVRYDNPGDGENRWSNRKDRLTGLIVTMPRICSELRRYYLTSCRI
jgi:hypothetical protein